MSKKLLLLSVGVIILVGGLIYRLQMNNSTATSADDAPPGSIHNLPVPKAVAATKEFAASDMKVPIGKVIVMSALEKEWPNSCLGLQQEDEMCAEVITPGYEITIEASGEQRIYRTNSDGSVIRVQK